MIQAVPAVDSVQSEATTEDQAAIERRRNFDSRIAKSLAVTRFVHSREKFEAANKDLNECCSEMRKHVGPSAQFITKVNYQTYLVTSDDEGNFDVKPIETI